jgi:excisionase family DNA binding protein
MATAQTRRLRSRPPLRRPTEDEIKQAQEATRLITSSPARMTIQDESGMGSHVEIPPLARTILEYVLAEMARGNGMILEPVPRLLTVPQASELLGASWTFVRELIDKGELACQMVDDEQRVVFEDLMAYEARNYEDRSKVLDELVALAQEMGLGY